MSPNSESLAFPIADSGDLVFIRAKWMHMPLSRMTVYPQATWTVDSNLAVAIVAHFVYLPGKSFHIFVCVDAHAKTFRCDLGSQQMSIC